MGNRVRRKRGKKKDLNNEENVRITIVPAGEKLSKIRTRFNSNSTEVLGLIINRDELNVISETKKQLSQK